MTEMTAKETFNIPAQEGFSPSEPSLAHQYLFGRPDLGCGEAFR